MIQCADRHRNQFILAYSVHPRPTDTREGYALAVKRMTEPESVFGQLKNQGEFRRFLFRGMEKVTLEAGWHSLAHNLGKQATLNQKSRAAILQ
uniref:transposase n=1 Tax=Paenibacillus albidus TaxID=2041023 RepID=UPI00227BD17D|nr:transposase [Paenibacillus albidus]